jgi:hypothetical protein
MGSNTLIRTYFLEEPIVHPILSHKVKLLILLANLKEEPECRGSPDRSVRGRWLT